MTSLQRLFIFSLLLFVSFFVVPFQIFVTTSLCCPWDIFSPFAPFPFYLSLSCPRDNNDNKKFKITSCLLSPMFKRKVQLKNISSSDTCLIPITPIIISVYSWLLSSLSSSFFLHLFILVSFFILHWNHSNILLIPSSCGSNPSAIRFRRLCVLCIMCLWCLVLSVINNAFHLSHQQRERMRWNCVQISDQDWPRQRFNSFSHLVLFFSWPQHVVYSEEIPEKKDGIQDKSLISLEDEHDLLKAESQDAISEIKIPFHQVRVPTHVSLFEPIFDFYQFPCRFLVDLLPYYRRSLSAVRENRKRWSLPRSNNDYSN